MTKDKQLKIIEEDYEVEVIDEEEVGVPTRIEPQVIGMDKMMEMATMLAKSTIVPQEYRNRPENVFLALDMANRMGLSPMSIMNNMYVVNGRPNFSGSFIAGLIKSTPLFSDVELVWVGEEGKDSWGCYISAKETRTGNTVKGATVTMKMAKGEGWVRNVKWQTMPELMLTYRAYSFFGRTHASELLTGVYDKDEMEDVRLQKQSVRNPYQK
ncbi:MAG TPA: hypothetical protein VFC79_09075 [Tissierellaceae bacterium]|nr:hypothetical protein [Tissierellaceae bacterium]